MFIFFEQVKMKYILTNQVSPFSIRRAKGLKSLQIQETETILKTMHMC
jgi:hypothetical protein